MPVRPSVHPGRAHRYEDHIAVSNRPGESSVGVRSWQTANFRRRRDRRTSPASSDGGGFRPLQQRIPAKALPLNRRGAAAR